MPENFGNLLYYTNDVNCNDDPYKGLKVLTKQGTADCNDRVIFDVPDDKAALKLDECMFQFKMTIPENFVPDNDVHAKIVKKLDVKILDNRIFSSFDTHEYTFFNHFITKLNYSPLAQECELFPSGRFDSLDPDSEELTTIQVRRNGLNLAENRRQVLPSGSRPNFEVYLNEQGNVLMEVEKYTKCRMTVPGINSLTTGDLPPNIKTIDSERAHATKADCDCTDEKYRSGKYKNLKQIQAKGEVIETVLSKLYGSDTFKAHSFDEAVASVTMDTEDERYGYIWMDLKLDPKSTVEVKDYILEAAYCEPGKEEKPLSTGVKGEGVIPFFYPRFTRKTLPVGLSQHDIELSTGPLPKMIIITGMPHGRYDGHNFRLCTTKTSMIDEKFRIKSFTVFVDNRPAFRSPWTTAQEHYINYMKHNGRWANKAVALGQDFFAFQKYNWMVPLFFDDRVGSTGIVTVRIEFEENLEEHWDACIMKIPRNELFLDANRNEASVLQKSAAGKKRKEPELKEAYKKCSKKKDVHNKSATSGS
ncbi:Oidioi.mRNA.OKI2018_I69.XSR.g14646.t1.cds [Oikopleura dioica]|uniref:Oidioi.mRNA.OKI2018_I69.XSR.g14646.t1.cds n=1 Tax=Oikopleura dioica TaxID=34765 RepID=A0ABN7SAE6_OIKDI|nr:Oidioi.mRNA.OKI2018_I69.XSR.g14646.t1.cds [Oikopleura dioica]